MMRMTSPRSAGAFTCAAVVAALMAVLAPAHGAPPENDSIAGATVTTTEPSSVTFDTTEATSDPRDGRCVGDRSVWFRFDAPSTRSIRMSTAGSTFDTRLAIFTGTRNDRSVVDCDNNSGPGRAAADGFRIREGQRYWVAVSSCCEPHPGGQAVLTIGRHGTPGAEIVVTGARSGEVSGRLYVEGTITCGTPSEVFLGGEATQRVGDATARGSLSGRVGRCGSEPVAWKAAADSATGWAFAPGSVLVEVRGRVWDGISTTRDRATKTVVASNDPLARPAR